MYVGTVNEDIDGGVAKGCLPPSCVSLGCCSGDCPRWCKYSVLGEHFILTYYTKQNVIFGKMILSGRMCGIPFHCWDSNKFKWNTKWKSRDIENQYKYWYYWNALQLSCTHYFFWNKLFFNQYKSIYLFIYSTL